MFFNFRLLPVFLLLFVAFYATFRGLEILKVEVFEMPFGSHEVVAGSRARWTGYGLIAVGVSSLLLLIAAFF